MTIKQLSDTELAMEIVLIEENVAECGRVSSYAERNLPRLREARAERQRRIRTAEHIEMDHERELAPPINGADVLYIHEQMHAQRDDWGHDHAHNLKVGD